MSRKKWMSLVPLFVLLALILPQHPIPSPGMDPSLQLEAVGGLNPMTPAAQGGFGFCAPVNEEGCTFSDMVCNGYSCCCVYSCPGGGGSTGPCFPTSPF